MNNKYQDIIDILQASTCAHLADCLDLIPEANLTAIQSMIDTKKRYCEEYKYPVVQDIVKLVEGNIEAPLYSEPYLETVNEGM